MLGSGAVELEVGTKESEHGLGAAGDGARRQATHGSGWHDINVGDCDRIGALEHGVQLPAARLQAYFGDALASTGAVGSNLSA